MIESTHIRITMDTKGRLDGWRGTGQSYDGAINDLLELAYGKGVIRLSPVSHELPEEPQVHSQNEAWTPSESIVETDHGALRIKNTSPPIQAQK